MATAVRLKHRQTGIVKTGYCGFSWTSFFFGGLAALFRGDLAYGLGVLATGILLASFSFGLLWFVVSLGWAFIYNNNYTQRVCGELLILGKSVIRHTQAPGVAGGEEQGPRAVLRTVRR